ncbi:MAG: hypothetical protein SV760_03250 [Halobacteria archaeon]|nr:hypothetical protein [Halobacteria archaeon]
MNLDLLGEKDIGDVDWKKIVVLIIVLTMVFSPIAYFVSLMLGG